MLHTGHFAIILIDLKKHNDWHTDMSIMEPISPANNNKHLQVKDLEDIEV